MSKVWSMRLGAVCGVAAIAISVLAEGDGSAAPSWASADFTPTRSRLYDEHHLILQNERRRA